MLYSDLNAVILENAKGEVTYRLLEKTYEYQEHQLKLCDYYSHTLKATKEKTII